jgi:putative metallopeptidase
MAADRPEAGLIRPRPPAQLLDVDALLGPPLFAPAPDLLAWAIETFIDPDGPLHNPDHVHLTAARLGMLWTNAGNSHHGRRVVGQCEFRPPGGSQGKWARARAEAQLYGWFGEKPDFLLTFEARYAATCSDAEFMCLVEHELSHAGQQQDEFGAPAFTKDGLPVFAMRAHDVETFIGLAARYGAVEAGVRELMEALSRAPSVAPAEVGFACGTCSR